MHQPIESWADSLIEKIELDKLTMIGIITIFKLERCIGRRLSYSEVEAVINDVLVIGEIE